MDNIINDIVTCQNVLFEERNFTTPIKKYHQCYPLALCIGSAFTAHNVSTKLKGGIVLIERAGFKNRIPSIHIWIEYADNFSTIYADPTYIQYKTDTPTDDKITLDGVLSRHFNYKIVENSIVDIPPSEDELKFSNRLIELQYYQKISLAEAIQLISNEFDLSTISFNGNEAYAYGCANEGKTSLLAYYNKLISNVQKEVPGTQVSQYLESQKLHYIFK
ncbi:hypothetical protein [uncultured Clostridium sp.]|uniref:hypothetical protein n=1 Tax=uncultured Clostridium sp. TaxID=59620 RepID=UPI00261479C8|nr:hypothetical protein [uncultured Clostridium sp.]